MAKKSKKTKALISKKEAGHLRVKTKNILIQERYNAMRERIFKQGVSMFGTMLLLAGKHVMKEMGHTVDVKINGEDITKLAHLAPPDLHERIKLAIEQERYEDAAKLRDLIKQLPNTKK